MNMSMAQKVKGDCCGLDRDGKSYVTSVSSQDQIDLGRSIANMVEINL